MTLSTKPLGLLGWSPELEPLWLALSSEQRQNVRGYALEAAPAFPPEVQQVGQVEALFAQAEVIWVGAPPHLAEQWLHPARLAIAERHLLLLPGAGWHLPQLLQQLPERKLVRVLLGTTPAPSGHAGPTLPWLVYAPTPYLTPQDEQTVQQLLGSAPALQAQRLPSEKAMNAALGLAQLAPIALLTAMEALVDSGFIEGLPRDTARLLTARLLHQTTGQMTQAPDVGPLREAALANPAGAEGLLTLETQGFRGILMKALRACVAFLRQQEK